MQHNRIQASISDRKTDQTLEESIAELIETIVEYNPTPERLFEILFTVSSDFIRDEEKFNSWAKGLIPVMQLYAQSYQPR